MTGYDGNQKGFIYVACEPARRDEVISRYLDPIESEDRPLCLGSWIGALRRRDRSDIAKAHAVMIFLTKEFAENSILEEIIELAEEHDRPMLVIYLDDVELNHVLTMQTDAQQALFLSRYGSDEELLEEIKSAAIFDDMQATPEQKKQQKMRTRLLLLAAVAVLAAALIVLKTGARIAAENDEADGALGLPGISMNDLKEIESISIVGNEIVFDYADCEYYRDPDSGKRDKSGIRYWIDYGVYREEKMTTPGDISDLSGLEHLENLRLLQLEGQQIEDISPLLELYKQRAEQDESDKSFELRLCCNPLSSIDGLEKFKTLGSLDISFTNVSELPEGLDVNSLRVKGTPLTSVPDFNGKEEMSFDASEVSFEDVSNLASAASYSYLALDANGKEEEIIGMLKGIPVEEFACRGMQINSFEELSGLDIRSKLNLEDSTLTSLDGIEHFEGIQELDLRNCTQLTDLSAVNDLTGLKKLVISEDMRYLADAVDSRTGRIELIVEQRGD